MNEALFKTTMMGGFNKSDVLAFIDKQDKQFKDREKDLLSQIETLNKSIRGETQHSSQLVEQVAALKTALEDEKTKASETEKNLQDADDTLNRARDEVTVEIRNRDEKIAALGETVNGLNIKLEDAEARAAEAERKLTFIKETEEQISQSLLETQKSASLIISNARTETQSMLNDSRAEAKRLLDKTNSEIESKRSQLQAKLNETLDRVAAFKAEAVTAEKEAEEFMEKISTAYKTIESGADELINTYTDSFKITVSEENINEEFMTPFKEEAAAVKFDFSGNAD